MFIVVISICEGILNDKYLSLASIYAWGIGYAFAALIGKRFGKHKIIGKFLKGKNSIKRTTVMYITSFIPVLVILFLRGGINIGIYIIISLLTALVSSVIELYTNDDNDTTTCLIASTLPLIALLLISGGL